MKNLKYKFIKSSLAFSICVVLTLAIGLFIVQPLMAPNFLWQTNLAIFIIVVVISLIMLALSSSKDTQLSNDIEILNQYINDLKQGRDNKRTPEGFADIYDNLKDLSSSHKTMLEQIQKALKEIDTIGSISTPLTQQANLNDYNKHLNNINNKIFIALENVKKLSENKDSIRQSNNSWDNITNATNNANKNLIDYKKQIHDLQIVLTRLSKGDFNARFSQSSSSQLEKDFNIIVTSVKNFLREIDKVSQNNFVSVIEGSYLGDLNSSKDNFNKTAISITNTVNKLKDDANELKNQNKKQALTSSRSARKNSQINLNPVPLIHNNFKDIDFTNKGFGKY
jgi:methyl-accepting chemotaxis protein